MPQILLFARSSEVNVCCGIGPCATPMPEVVCELWTTVLVGSNPVAMLVISALRSTGTMEPMSIESLTGFAYASMRSKVEVGAIRGVFEARCKEPMAVLVNPEIGVWSVEMTGWAGSVFCAGSAGCWGEGDCGGSCGWAALALVRHCDCSTVPAGAIVGGFKLVKHSAVLS